MVLYSILYVQYIPVMLSNGKRFKFTFNNGIIQLISLLASATHKVDSSKIVAGQHT